MEPAVTPERALEIFRVLGNPIRTSIFRVMMGGSPMRVADVAAQLRKPPNSISYHMRQMANAGFIRKADPPGPKDGRETWWILDKQISAGGNLRAVSELPGGDVALAGFDRAQAGPILDLFSSSRWVKAQELNVPQSAVTGLADLTTEQARKFVGAYDAAIAEVLAASRENNQRIAQASEEDREGAQKDEGSERILRYEFRVAIIPVVDDMGK